MGLDNIRKKSDLLGRPKSTMVKTNMYESPQMALDLIAHICTASRDLDVDHCFDDYENVLVELNDKIKEKNFLLFNEDFLSDCHGVINNLVLSLLTDVSANLKIAVAGGFSAGKSSLLNALTGIGSLLPTGIEPMSMVKTNLNCSTSCNNLIVRGENIKGDIVLLNKDVLACVQHASKSKVYVASVLNRIIMDVPTPQAPYLNGVTFIDTPGYDNSHDTNKENQTKDIDTALAAINEADVLFWCIDIEKGTVPNNDIQMIKQIQQANEAMPIILFFTKMDKKAEKDAVAIIETASKICQKELKNKPADIIGVSCVGNSVSMKFLNNHSIEEVFKRIRTTTGTTDYLQLAENQIQGWFEDEITASNNTSDKYEKDRTESIKQKQEWQELYYRQKNDNKEEVDHIKDVLLNSYDEIMTAADKRFEAFQKALKGWSDSLDREEEWDGKSGLFDDTSSLLRQHGNAINNYNRIVQLDLGYQYYKREHRDDLCERIKKLLDRTLEEINNYREEEEERTKSLADNIQNESELRALIGKYQPIVLQTLSHCYNACKTLIIDHMNRLQQLPIEKDDDVFSAIHSDNYKRFLACFSSGVDMCKYDPEGYSPLTLACKMGNNEMVKFFIERDVDLASKDGRGCNALETAAIYNFRDICELLCEADKTLVSKSGDLVELSRQNTFIDWISKI